MSEAMHPLAPPRDRDRQVGGHAAAKMDYSNRAYCEELVEQMKSPHVEFLGEVDEVGKAALFAGAHALLFPIDWPEPFGLAMIEAMAFGVPVIAWSQGSVPEVVDDGDSGFVVDTIDDAVAAIKGLGRSTGARSGAGSRSVSARPAWSMTTRRSTPRLLQACTNPKTSCGSFRSRDVVIRQRNCPLSGRGNAKNNRRSFVPQALARGIAAASSTGSSHSSRCCSERSDAEAKIWAGLQPTDNGRRS